MKDIIAVGLIEDQYLFREGMKAILNNWSDIEVIFEAADGFSVLDKLENSGTIPDVMLVDLSLPSTEDKKEFSGQKVTQCLLEKYPSIKILILSAHDDDNFINQLIQSGAHGYLVKDCDPQEVHEAILNVFHKGSYINEMTLKAIQNNMRKGGRVKKATGDITKREKEILELVCQQYTAEEIAEKLFLSVKTVNGHRNNLLQKTGSRNVTGLVIYAVRNNIYTVT